MQRRKQLLYLFVLLFFGLLVLVACKNKTKDFKSEEITINEKAQITAGEVFELEFTSEKHNYSDLDFIITSTDNNIARAEYNKDTKSINIVGLTPGKISLNIEDLNLKISHTIDVEVILPDLKDDENYIPFKIKTSHNIDKIYLYGDFNSWDKESATELKKDGNTFIGNLICKKDSEITYSFFIKENGKILVEDTTEKNILKVDDKINPVEKNILKWKEESSTGETPIKPEDPVDPNKPVNPVDPGDPTNINKEEMDLKFEITAPDGTPNVYLYGSFNNWDILNAVELEKDSNGLFKTTIKNAKATEDNPFEYKFMYDKHTEAEEFYNAGKPHTITNFNDIEPDLGIVYTILEWESIPGTLGNYPFRFEINIHNSKVFEKEGYSFYIFGSFNGWKCEKLTRNTKNNEIFTYEKTTYNSCGKDLEYHILTSLDDLEIVSELNWDNIYKSYNSGTSNIVLGNMSSKITKDELTTIKLDIQGFYNDETKDPLKLDFTTIDLNFIITLKDTAKVDNVYVYGSFNDWDIVNAVELKKDVNDIFRTTIKNAKATKDNPFKYKFLYYKHTDAEELRPNDEAHTIMSFSGFNTDEGIKYEISEWESTISDFKNYSFRFEIDIYNDKIFEENNYSFYLIGSFTGGKPIKLEKDENDNTIFSYEVKDYESFGKDLKYHIITSNEDLNEFSWEKVFKSYKNNTKEPFIGIECNIKKLTYGDPNITKYVVLGFANENNGKFEKPQLTFESIDLNFIIKLDADAIVDNVYIYGSFNNWDLENAIELKKDTNGLFKTTIRDIKTNSKEPLTFKFLYQKHLDANEFIIDGKNENNHIIYDFLEFDTSKGFVHTIKKWETNPNDYGKYPVLFQAKIHNSKILENKGYLFYLYSSLNNWKPIKLERNNNIFIYENNDNISCGKDLEYHILTSRHDLEVVSVLNWDNIYKSYNSGTNNIVLGNMTSKIIKDELTTINLDIQGFYNDETKEELILEIDTLDLDFTITLLKEAEVEKVYIYGSFNNWDLENAIELKKDADGLFKTTIKNLTITPKKPLKYKFLYEKHIEAEEFRLDTSSDKEHILTTFKGFNTDDGITYTIKKWESDPKLFGNNSYKFNVEIWNNKLYEKDGYNFYIIGNMTNWEELIKLKKDSSTGKYIYQKSPNHSPNKPLEYHIIAAKGTPTTLNDLDPIYKSFIPKTKTPFANYINNKEELKLDELTVIDIEIQGFYHDQTKEELKFTTNKVDIPFTITLKENATTATKVYIYGSFNNWDLENAVELIKDTDGLFKATIKDLEAPFEYKFIYEKGIEAEEKFANDKHIINNFLLFNTNKGINYSILNWKSDPEKYGDHPYRIELDIWNSELYENSGYSFYLLGKSDGFTKLIPLTKDLDTKKYIYEKPSPNITYNIPLEFQIILAKDGSSIIDWESKTIYKSYIPGTRDPFTGSSNNEIELTLNELTTINLEIQGFQNHITKKEPSITSPIDLKFEITLEKDAETENVYIYGSFNQWDINNPVELIKDASGKFKGIIENAKPGIEYKFLSYKGSMDTEESRPGNAPHKLESFLTFNTTNGIIHTIKKWNKKPGTLKLKVELEINPDTISGLASENFRYFYLIGNIDPKDPNTVWQNPLKFEKNTNTNKYELEIETTVFYNSDGSFNFEYHIITSQKENYDTGFNWTNIKKSCYSGTHNPVSGNIEATLHNKQENLIQFKALHFVN